MTTRKKSLIIASFAIAIGITERINHVYHAKMLQNQALSKAKALRAEQILESTVKGTDDDGVLK